MAVEENLRKYNPYINKINSDDCLLVLGGGDKQTMFVCLCNYV